MTSASWHTFYWLVRCEFYKVHRKLSVIAIDMALPAISSTLVWGYVMPMLGLPTSYGGFWILAWMMIYGISTCLNDNAKNLLMDAQGDRTVDYELTLPISSRMAYLRIVVSQSLEMIALTLPAVFIGKLLLGDRFDWSQTSWTKYFLMYLLIVFCTSCASLVAYRLKGPKEFQRFWRRWGREMIFLGATQFPLAALYKVLPALAYVMLLNPFTYANEGLRAAMFGQDGYLNYWVCCGVMGAFTTVFAGYSFYWFRRRLDCL
jgi:ABC-type polysaccharide/polyol phosphate export permease